MWQTGVVHESIAGSRAAIDCGTNSTRLLIVNGHGEVIRREMQITRLGQGVDSSGLLAGEAIERTLVALQSFRGQMSSERIDRARLVATSAVRDARNGATFLAAAGAVVGVEAEVLSGEEEGRLSCIGALAGLPRVSGDDLVVDIGGGSTEIALQRDEHVSAVSLEIGCVRVTERYLKGDPPDSRQIGAATAAIHNVVEVAKASLPTLPCSTPPRQIGVAGTVSTLAALEIGLNEYDPKQLHGTVLTLDQVDQWCKILATESSLEKSRRPAIIPGREDIIAAGALILREVMTTFNVTTCTVSETDILDGLILSLAAP